jgi:6-pyruvoyl-tetrahydropterin synthase
MEINFVWNNVWEKSTISYMLIESFVQKVESNLKFHEINFVWNNLQQISTISYMLPNLFAQKLNSNSKKKEMNCSKNCNSKLFLIGDIYTFNWMVFQVGKS